MYPHTGAKAVPHPFIPVMRPKGSYFTIDQVLGTDQSYTPGAIARISDIDCHESYVKALAEMFDRFGEK